MAELVDFDAFYLATRHALLAQLTLMSADREQAEDVVQEAYLRAWAHWDRLGRTDDPAAWIRMAAWRLTAAGPRQRAGAAWRARRQPVACHETVPTRPEDAMDVPAALTRLPEGQRLVLVLHELCDLTVAQVAAQTGLAVGTVTTRLIRGRATLAELLAARGRPMSDLRELLTSAARDVPDGAWLSAAELRSRAQRQARRRRTNRVVAASTATVVGLVAWHAPGALRGSPPAPAVPRDACLVAARSSHLVPSPYTVLIGGRQLLEVDLARGSARPLSPCLPHNTNVEPLAVPGARVVRTDREPDGPTTVRFSHSRTGTSTVAASGARPLVGADGGLVLVRATGTTGKPETTLERYDRSGRRTSTLVLDDDLSVLGVVANGVLALGRGPDAALVLVDPTNGRLRDVLGSGHHVLGAGGRLIASVKGAEVPSRLVGHPANPLGLCGSTCPPVQITDVVTGQSRAYAELPSGRAFTRAEFSPDGTQVAFTTADDPPTRDGASVTVLNLTSGHRSTVGHIHTTATPDAPSASWTPDGQDLVLADVTAGRVRLLVWHRFDGRVTHAVTLVGDNARLTLDVIGPSLAAWR